MVAMWRAKGDIKIITTCKYKEMQIHIPAQGDREKQIQNIQIVSVLPSFPGAPAPIFHILSSGITEPSCSRGEFLHCVSVSSWIWDSLTSLRALDLSGEIHDRHRGAPLSPLSKCVMVGARGFGGLMGWALAGFYSLGGLGKRAPNVVFVCWGWGTGQAPLGHTGGGTSISSLSAPGPH